MSSKQPLKGSNRLRASKKVQPIGNKTDQDALDKHKTDWANTLTFKQRIGKYVANLISNEHVEQ